MDPFLAEIRIFAGNFAPKGWAFCNGQVMAISQNTALFSILGTTYGGDGKSNFALPNLQNSFAMQFGQGPGLTYRALGETGGEAIHSLTTAEIPAHTHQLKSDGAATTGTPSTGVALGPASANIYAPLTTPIAMASNAVGIGGGSQPHENRQPYLALSFIISLQGVFPPRS